jgi:hypothetical protein
MGDHVVDVERVDEESASARNSFWRRSLSSVLGQDVDVPAGELRGQAHVLAAAADREAELIVGHHHLDAVRSSSSTTLATSAGARALTTKVAGSCDHWMMSIFSPCSS